MADRMRVTALMGDPERLQNPRGMVSANSLGGLRQLRPPGGVGLVDALGPFRKEETVDESTSLLAANPGFFRHAARPRAVTGTALQRRRAAPYSPARRPYRTHAGLH